MKEASRLKQAYRQFYDALILGGVERIVMVAHEIFQRPVIFTDENYHLICQVPKQAIGNDIWDTLLNNRKLPTETIWEYQSQLLNDQNDAYKPFYADWGPVRRTPRIFGEVRHGQKIIGHVAIFMMEKPLQNDDLEITQLLIDALTIETMKKQTSYQNHQLSYSASLIDLLDPHSTDLAKHSSAEKLQEKMPGDYILLVTPIGKKASKKAFVSYLVNEYAQYDYNVLSVLHEDAVVTLIGSINFERTKIKKHPLIKSIINLLSKHHLISGLSDGFFDLKEIQFRFKQAFLTAKIATAKQDTVLGLFGDYAPLQLFVEIVSQDEPNLYIHPVLHHIQNYDFENKTEYYHTLQAYIFHIFNKTSTIHSLSIHRNTLQYRLNRISEIFQLNYEDEQTAFHLYCSFMLLEANKLV